MPTTPMAMAAASERPPMIVSAGYFSSRRAPSFQSSHETAGPSYRGRRLPVHHLPSYLLLQPADVHRAVLIEPADGSIALQTRQCLQVEVSIP